MNEAERIAVRARAASGLATAGALGLVVLLGPDPLGFAFALAAAGLLFVMSPVGSLASIFTLWAGRWVNSCPNCPAARLDRMEVDMIECSVCGDVEPLVEPVRSPGWYYRPSEDEWTCAECRDL